MGSISDNLLEDILSRTDIVELISGYIPLKKKRKVWFLFHLDMITIYWNNLKRYVLTAVDYASRFGYARMYENKSSKVAMDFLYRLQYVIQQPIENIQTDNGSEFAHYFEEATRKLKIDRYFS